MRHILVRHEQGATHAAEGYARSTGKVGCVLVTSGPGATNAVTGITDALMDSIPLVCITGQVPTHLIGTDAFQECDTVGITRPCTKHNYLVKNVADLPHVLHEAFYVATTGRPGPVVVDIPKDIQFASGDYAKPNAFQHKGYRPQAASGDADRIAAAVDLMAGAKRPLFYTGGGVINSGPRGNPPAARVDQDHRIPRDVDPDGPWRRTRPATRNGSACSGMHGTYQANLAMHDCDVMVCIGARFDDRITGRLDAFSPHSKRIHIDIDPSSINKNVKADIGDHRRLRPCARRHAGADGVPCGAAPDRAALKAWWAADRPLAGAQIARLPQLGRHHQAAIRNRAAVSRLTRGRDVFVTTEVGQHQMWAAQFFRFEEPNHWMTSGGLGTMGYGLPAAVGVQLAHPDALVIDIAGEASVLMTMQEMSTAVQYRLPIKIFILNNQYMGMVRQWQELLHGGRYSESYTAALPDFVKLAEAYHAVGIRCDKPGELDAAINAMIDVRRPVIFDCVVDQNENCFPMIPSGRAHNEMLLGDAAESFEDAVTAEGKMMV